MLYWKDIARNVVDHVSGTYRYPKKMLGRSAGPGSQTTAASPVVLVVAAHPDDEIIAIGGTINRIVQAGTRVIVVFVTNGSRGLPAAVSVEHRVAIRESEALEALSAVGVDKRDVSFLGFPDTGCYRYMSLIARDLYGVFQRYEPEEVYVHGIEGGHIDHDVIGYVVQRIVEQVSVRNIWEWAEYNGQFPLQSSEIEFPDDSQNRSERVLLTRVELSQKAIALQRYESQQLPSECLRSTEIIRRADTATARTRFLSMYDASPFWRVRLRPACDELEKGIDSVMVNDKDRFRGGGNRL